MCGIWNVDGLAETMPSELFDEWYVYFHKFEPWGDEWLQTSHICSVISNLLASKKSELIDFDYFVPKYDLGGEGKQTKNNGELSIAEQEKMLEMMYG
jgi:hypothetical protein